MKTTYYAAIIFAIVILKTNVAACQDDRPRMYPPNNNINPNNPYAINVEDYHLNKREFLNYYGVNDTARAIINLFFRKRGQSIGLAYCLVPGASCFGGLAIEGIGVTGGINGAGYFFSTPSSQTFVSAIPGLVLLSGAIYLGGIIVYPIIISVNRAKYNRQKLLYVLADLERGKKIPFEILAKLKPVDFR